MILIAVTGFVSALPVDVTIEAATIFSIVEICVHAIMAFFVGLANAPCQRVLMLVSVLLAHLRAPLYTRDRLVVLVQEVLAPIAARTLGMSLVGGLFGRLDRTGPHYLRFILFVLVWIVKGVVIVVWAATIVVIIIASITVTSTTVI